MSPTDPGDILTRVLARLDAIEDRLNLLEGARRRPVFERERLREETARTPIEETSQAERPLIEQEFKEDDTREQANSHPHLEAPLETQVGLTWLNRIGVLTVVLGVAFFFKYAVDNGFIGEAGRVILGVFTSFVTLALAEIMWRRDHRIYAQGITGAGIAILYLSLYASFGFYHLLPQFAAFFLMFLGTTLAVALALRYNSIAIAFLGFIGGYLTPLLLSTNESQPWTLFGYLLILQAGGIALVRRTSWRYLEPLLLAGTAFVYQAAQIAGNEGVNTISVLTFYALFWVFSSRGILMAAHILAVLGIISIWPGPQSQSVWINLVLAGAALYAVERRSQARLSLLAFSLFWFSAGVWATKSPSHFLFGITGLTAGFVLFLIYALRKFMSQVDVAAAEPQGNEAFDLCLVVLGLDGLAYFGICYGLLQADYHAFLGLFAATLAAVHRFAAWQLWQQIEPDEALADFSSPRFRPILLSVGIAVTFLTLAIPIQFSGYRITMSWAVEGAIFTWIAARTGNKRFGAAALIIFVLAFGRLLFADALVYESGYPPPLLANPRFLTMVVTGVCAWLGARWMEKGPPAIVLYAAGHFAVIWALLIETFDWSMQRTSMGDPGSIGTVAASILLALYGIVLVILGVTTRSAVNRILGLGLLAIVILKLYLHDVWQLQETFRIVAFVVLGVLLLAASFLYSRFRGVVEKLWDRSK